MPHEYFNGYVPQHKPFSFSNTPHNLPQIRTIPIHVEFCVGYRSELERLRSVLADIEGRIRFTSSPSASQVFEVTIAGKKVHSMRNGDGWPDPFEIYEQVIEALQRPPPSSQLFTTLPPAPSSPSTISKAPIATQPHRTPSPAPQSSPSAGPPVIVRSFVPSEDRSSFSISRSTNTNDTYSHLNTHTQTRPQQQTQGRTQSFVSPTRPSRAHTPLRAGQGHGVSIPVSMSGPSANAVSGDMPTSRGGTALNVIGMGVVVPPSVGVADNGEDEVAQLRREIAQLRQALSVQTGTPHTEMGALQSEGGGQAVSRQSTRERRRGGGLGAAQRRSGGNIPPDDVRCATGGRYTHGSRTDGDVYEGDGEAARGPGGGDTDVYDGGDGEHDDIEEGVSDTSGGDAYSIDNSEEYLDLEEDFEEPSKTAFSDPQIKKNIENPEFVRESGLPGQDWDIEMIDEQARQVDADLGEFLTLRALDHGMTEFAHEAALITSPDVLGGIGARPVMEVAVTEERGMPTPEDIARQVLAEKLGEEVVGEAPPRPRKKKRVRVTLAPGGTSSPLFSPLQLLRPTVEQPLLSCAFIIVCITLIWGLIGGLAFSQAGFIHFLWVDFPMQIEGGGKDWVRAWGLADEENDPFAEASVAPAVAQKAWIERGAGRELLSRVRGIGVEIENEGDGGGDGHGSDERERVGRAVGMGIHATTDGTPATTATVSTDIAPYASALNVTATVTAHDAMVPAMVGAVSATAHTTTTHLPAAASAILPSTTDSVAASATPPAVAAPASEATAWASPWASPLASVAAEESGPHAAAPLAPSATVASAADIVLLHTASLVSDPTVADMSDMSGSSRASEVSDVSTMGADVNDLTDLARVAAEHAEEHAILHGHSSHDTRDILGTLTIAAPLMRDTPDTDHVRSAPSTAPTPSPHAVDAPRTFPTGTTTTIQARHIGDTSLLPHAANAGPVREMVDAANVQDTTPDIVLGDDSLYNDNSLYDEDAVHGVEAAVYHAMRRRAYRRHRHAVTHASVSRDAHAQAHSSMHEYTRTPLSSTTSSTSTSTSTSGPTPPSSSSTSSSGSPAPDQPLDARMRSLPSVDHSHATEVLRALQRYREKHGASAAWRALEVVSGLGGKEQGQAAMAAAEEAMVGQQDVRSGSERLEMESSHADVASSSSPSSSSSSSASWFSLTHALGSLFRATTHAIANTISGTGAPYLPDTLAAIAITAAPNHEGLFDRMRVPTSTRTRTHNTQASRTPSALPPLPTAHTHGTLHRTFADIFPPPSSSSSSSLDATHAHSPLHLRTTATSIPSDTEDRVARSSRAGGYYRNIAKKAASRLSRIRLDHLSAVTLTRSLAERDLQVVYKARDGDVFNMEHLSRALQFESSIRSSSAFQRHCLLDWSTVKTGGQVYYANGSAVLDDTGVPVQGALANQRLAAVSAVEHMLGDPDAEYILLQTYDNMREYNRRYLAKEYPQLQCAWPIGPLRPSPSPPPNETLVISPEKLCALGMCKPLGLLNEKAQLIEALKNDRLALYSTIRVPTTRMADNATLPIIPDDTDGSNDADGGGDGDELEPASTATSTFAFASSSSYVSPGTAAGVDSVGLDVDVGTSDAGADVDVVDVLARRIHHTLGTPASPHTTSTSSSTSDSMSTEDRVALTFAPAWFDLVDSSFGSGNPTGRAFRTTFQLALPLDGYDNITNSDAQARVIESYIIDEFLPILLKYADDYAPSLVLTFESIESGALTGLFEQELVNSLPLIGASLVTCFIALLVVLQSGCMAGFGILLASTSAIPAFLLYRLCGYSYVGLYHGLAVLVITFVTCDSLFVFSAEWDQAERLYAPIPILARSGRLKRGSSGEQRALLDEDPDDPEDDGLLTSLRRFRPDLLAQMALDALRPLDASKAYLISWTWRRLSFTLRRSAMTLSACIACLCLSLCVNASMNLPALRAFAVFSSLMALTNVCTVIIAWPSMLACHRKYLTDRRCCLLCAKDRADLDLAQLQREQVGTSAQSDATTTTMAGGGRLSRSELFFHVSLMRYLMKNRFASLFLMLIISAAVTYSSVAGLRVDSADVGSAMFVAEHPINRFNEVRSLFRSGAAIRIDIAFGLDSANPVDRSHADPMDPQSYGRPRYTAIYKNNKGSFDVFAARYCILSLCDWLSIANDDLRLTTRTQLSEPTCLLREMSDWWESADLGQYGLANIPNGLYNASITEDHFWYAYLVFLAFEKDFCTENGATVPCASKYRENLVLYSDSQAGNGFNESAVFDLLDVQTKVLTIEVRLSQNREIYYPDGIKLFRKWEEQVRKFLGKTSPSLGCRSFSGALPSPQASVQELSKYAPYHSFGEDDDAEGPETNGMLSGVTTIGTGASTIVTTAPVAADSDGIVRGHGTGVSLHASFSNSTSTSASSTSTSGSIINHTSLSAVQRLFSVPPTDTYTGFAAPRRHPLSTTYDDKMYKLSTYSNNNDKSLSTIDSSTQYEISRILRYRGAQPSHSFRTLARAADRRIPAIPGLSVASSQNTCRAHTPRDTGDNEVCVRELDFRYNTFFSKSHEYPKSDSLKSAVIGELAYGLGQPSHQEKNNSEKPRTFEFSGRAHADIDAADSGTFADMYSLRLHGLPDGAAHEQTHAHSTFRMGDSTSTSTLSSPAYPATQLSLGALAGVQYGAGTTWDPWHSYFYQEVFGEEMTRAVALAIALVFTWLLIYTGTPVVALIATVCVLITEAFMLGVIPVFGYSAGIVTAIPMLVFPGIAAVHMVRIASAYVSSGSRNPADKVRETLTKTSAPIVATCVTIMCSCAFLVFSQTAIFRNFGSLILVTTGFHTFMTLIVCPSLLLLFGPSAQNGNVYMLLLHSRPCRRVIAQHHRWSKLIRRQERVLHEGKALEIARAKADQKARVALREALHSLQHPYQWRADMSMDVGKRAGDVSIRTDAGLGMDISTSMDAPAMLLPQPTLRQLEEGAAEGARDLILTSPDAAKAWEAYQTLLQEPKKACHWYRVPYGVWIAVCYGNMYCCRQCRRRLRETRHDLLRDGGEEGGSAGNNHQRSEAKTGTGASKGDAVRVGEGEGVAMTQYLDDPIPLVSVQPNTRVTTGTDAATSIGMDTGVDVGTNEEGIGSDSDDEDASASELSFSEEEEETAALPYTTINNVNTNADACASTFIAGSTGSGMGASRAGSSQIELAEL